VIRGVGCCSLTHSVIAEEEATYRGDDTESDGFDAAVGTVDANRTERRSEMCSLERDMD
jgi:hypothetical protein